MKKKELLTVKELAAELRMSLKSIQRAYRKEEIPVEWLGRMARFDLAQVRRAMERNGTQWTKPHAPSQEFSVTTGRDRRPRPAARPANRPRSVKRGRNFHGFLRRIT